VPAAIDVEWLTERRRAGLVCRDLRFCSPLQELPPAVATLYMRAWTRGGNAAACVRLAASRDEGYWIREQVFGWLPERGIPLYLFENPYYGLRRDGRGPSESQWPTTT
jgi:hypothetical protein